jgi:hypothetical protein
MLRDRYSREMTKMKKRRKEEEDLCSEDEVRTISVLNIT